MFRTDTQQCSNNLFFLSRENRKKKKKKKEKREKSRKVFKKQCGKVFVFFSKMEFFTKEQYYQFLSALPSKINGLLIKIAVSLKDYFATRLDNSSFSIRRRYKKEN